MAKEREISNEQILYVLMTERENKTKGQNINKDLCRQLGEFNYKIKDTNENVLTDLFLISETIDGITNSIIYDKNGKYIANQKENEELQIAEDVKFNEKQLIMLIQSEARDEQEGSEDDNNNNNNAKADRDKPREEKVEEKEDKNKNKEQEEKQEETIDKDKMENIISEVNLNDRSLIPLDTIIDEKPLFVRLQLRQKLSGKLPEGRSVESFRDGYLTYAESKELTDKDGKERKTELVPVIATRNKDCVIELDENILEPQEKGSIAEQMKRENTRIQTDEFGNEVKNPKNESQLADIARFKINDDKNINGPNVEYITFRENEAHKRNGVNDTLGYNTEIYYEKGPKGNIGTLDKEKGYYLYSQELQSERRSKAADRTPKETKHEKEIKEYQSPREGVHDYFAELAKEILAENTEIAAVYGEKDIMEEIKKQVQQDESLDNDQIKEKVIGSLEGQRFLGDGYNGIPKH